jgi:hypothetical protein
MKAPRPGGIYQHYKGGMYRVLHLAVHTETEEELVVYQYISGVKPTDGRVWCRPLAMWNEPVEPWSPKYGPRHYTGRFYDNGNVVG